MKTQAIITVEGKKYMNTKIAADLWGLSTSTVANYCRKDIIINKFKINKKRWYISIDEIKPLPINDIHKLLVLTLQLKNNPTLDIDWSTFSFDETSIKTIYTNLVSQKYIEKFEISNIKRIPYEVVLTQKGFDLATKFSKKETTDFSSVLTNYTTILANIATIVVNVSTIVANANLACG